MSYLKPLLAALTTTVIVACGGGGGSSDFTAGIGGTGISYGSATGFGSIIVNGVEYEVLDGTDVYVNGSSGDQSDLGVGMVVTVTHDDSDNAKSVDYKRNAKGPIADLIDASSFKVMGLTVRVDALTAYAGGIIGMADLDVNDVVEVSGLITGDNSILATRVAKLAATCPTDTEVRGTVSNVSDDEDTFVIGTLMVIGTDVDNGDYVEVESSGCPVDNVMTSSSIEITQEGPDLDDLDDLESEMELEGLVGPDPTGSGDFCELTVNGQAVRTDSGTIIDGTSNCADLTEGTEVEVHGQLDTSGVLIADEIGLEDEEDEEVTDEFAGIVTVESQSSAFVGTISVSGVTGTFSVDLTTQFEGESQTFDLDTMASMPTCAEVKVNSLDHVLSIEEEDMDDCI